jgi:hypothetical protein
MFTFYTLFFCQPQQQKNLHPNTIYISPSNNIKNTCLHSTSTTKLFEKNNNKHKEKNKNFPNNNNNNQFNPLIIFFLSVHNNLASTNPTFCTNLSLNLPTNFFASSERINRGKTSVSICRNISACTASNIRGSASNV